MNYGKRLIILLGLLAIVIGVVFAVRSMNRPEPPFIVDTTPTASSDAAAQSTTEPPVTTTKGLSLEERKKAIDTAAIKPNELGEIMVLMYHRIGDEDLEYDRSKASFRKDLQALYDRGFRSVSVDDYVHSRFDIPAGTTPVLFTFDDGDITHFKVARNAKGELIPDPDCAVGILDAFYKEHPDFGRNAIFYLNAGAFGEPEHLEWKLNYLLDHGYEIGNHTYGHDFLNNLNASEVQESIGRNIKFYKNICDRVEMKSMALPYGISPAEELEHLAVKGEYDGLSYHNEVLFLVGWRPTWPLYIKGLNPTGINRVQSGEMEHQMWWWLDVYEDNPENRFISDGDPEIISIPESWAEDLNRESVEEERVLIYPPAE